MIKESRAQLPFPLTFLEYIMKHFYTNSQKTTKTRDQNYDI